MNNVININDAVKRDGKSELKTKVIEELILPINITGLMSFKNQLKILSDLVMQTYLQLIQTPENAMGNLDRINVYSRLSRAVVYLNDFFINVIDIYQLTPKITCRSDNEGELVSVEIAFYTNEETPVLVFSVRVSLIKVSPTNDIRHIAYFNDDVDPKVMFVKRDRTYPSPKILSAIAKNIKSLVSQEGFFMLDHSDNSMGGVFSEGDNRNVVVTLEYNRKIYFQA